MPIARELLAVRRDFYLRCASYAGAEPHGADGLAGRCAVGTGDAGHGNGNVDARHAQRAPKVSSTLAATPRDCSLAAFE